MVEEPDSAGPRVGATANRWGDTPEPSPPAVRPGRRKLLAALMGLGLTVGIGASVRYAMQRRMRVRGVLPGEFEQQDALVLSWDDDLKRDQYRTLADVITATGGQLDVILLTNTDAVGQRARKLLDEFQTPLARVRFFTCPVNLPWVRDFGPLQIKTLDGAYLVVDTVYDSTDYESAETPEDTLPSRVASLLGLESIEAPIVLLGGNLLSNGAGLCLTTTKTASDNKAILGYTTFRVRDLLHEYFGGEQVVFLEPLTGERTQHIDMFATFTAPDTIVVGQYDPAYDPVNAAILDRNAKLLAETTTSRGPLTVQRIPMPPRSREGWFWTYTNVVYANGVLLVPTYAGVDPQLESKAHAVFAALLPTWRIVPVDASALMRDFGGLHCATMNICRTSAATK